MKLFGGDQFKEGSVHVFQGWLSWSLATGVSYYHWKTMKQHEFVVYLGPFMFSYTYNYLWGD